MGKHSGDGTGNPKQGKGRHAKSEQGSTSPSNPYRPYTKETLWEQITGKKKGNGRHRSS